MYYSWLCALTIFVWTRGSMTTMAFCMAPLHSSSGTTATTTTSRGHPPRRTLPNHDHGHGHGHSRPYGEMSRAKVTTMEVGDFFSGMMMMMSSTTPPSVLTFPPETLFGTSIDPSSSGVNDVDLKRVYKASKDGWSALDFHRCCDGRGSGLVVALSKSGTKFGGFNPLGWSSTDDYGSSNSAFLWYVKGGGGGGSGNVVKCPVLTGGNAVIYDFATGGPQFGSADLIIGPPRAAVMGGFAGPDMEDLSKNAGDLRYGTSSLGGAYEVVEGWPMRGEFRLVELEVYCNGNVKPRDLGGSGFRFWPF